MILVTGGTGLLGSHLLYDLAKSGKRLRAIKRSNSDISNTKKTFNYYSSNSEKLFSLIEWIDADVLDIHSFLDALNGIEEIYHCAAMVSFVKRDHDKMLKTNIEGTANVVNAALEKKVKKMCYVSSIAALGKNLNVQQITENTFWKSSPDNSVYSISKYGAEREVWRGIQEGLNAVIVNPSLIVGPGNWNNGSSKIFTTAYKGLKFYTKGVTGFVDVRDVSKIMIRLMESEIKNERFIISAENNSYKHFFDSAASNFDKRKPYIEVSPLLSGLAWRISVIKTFITGKESIITQETAKAAHQKNYFSNQKIKKTLNYEFISSSQSIRETCSIFKKEKDPMR